MKENSSERYAQIMSARRQVLFMLSMRVRRMPCRECRNELTMVLENMRLYGHELINHATVIFSHSELALEVEVENSSVRSHVTAIHDSAKEVASLSRKLVEIGTK